MLSLMLCLFTALDPISVLRLRCCRLLCPLALGKGASVLPDVFADSDLDVAEQVESKEKVLKLIGFGFIYKGCYGSHFSCSRA